VASSQSKQGKTRRNEKLGKKKEKVFAIIGKVKSQDKSSLLEAKTLESNNSKERSSQKSSDSKSLDSLSTIKMITDVKSLGSAFSSKTSSRPSQSQKTCQELTGKLSNNKAKDRASKCKKKDNLTNGRLNKCDKDDTKKQLHSDKKLSAELCEANTQQISEQFKSKSSVLDETVGCSTKSASNKLVKRKGVTLKNEQICKKSKAEDLPVIKGNIGLPLGKRRLDVDRLKMHLKNAKQPQQHIDDDIKMLIDTRQETTLNNRMSCQLNSARFRYINEQLYTCSGNEAAEMFNNDRESFDVYHTGFQSQVDKWPVNPVDVMIDYIRHW